MPPRFPALGLSLVLFLALGCGGSEDAATAKGNATIPDSIWVAVAPAGAVAAHDLRSDGKPYSADDTESDEVVVVGRLKDFVEGLSAFTLTDRRLDPCPPEEGCPTPWDYCCNDSTTIAEHTVLVEIRRGEVPYNKDLKGVGGLDNLDEVTVKGTARRDSSGNITVIASAIHRK